MPIDKRPEVDEHKHDRKLTESTRESQSWIGTYILHQNWTHWEKVTRFCVWLWSAGWDFVPSTCTYRRVLGVVGFFMWSLYNDMSVVIDEGHPRLRVLLSNVWALLPRSGVDGPTIWWTAEVPWTRCICTNFQRFFGGPGPWGTSLLRHRVWLSCTSKLARWGIVLGDIITWILDQTSYVMACLIASWNS